jgi:hypothetical protein
MSVHVMPSWVLICLAGYINFGKQQYQDASGFDLDSQVLVFKVQLPKGAKPI